MGRKPSRKKRRHSQRAKKRKRADKTRARSERLESPSLALGPKALIALAVFVLAVTGLFAWRLSRRLMPAHEHKHQHDHQDSPSTNAPASDDKARNADTGPDSPHDDGH